MGRESAPAISAEQFYVSVSRARDRCTVYSDMAPAQLREAVQRSDRRMSATELMGGQAIQDAKPAPRLADKARHFVKKVQATYRQLRGKLAEAISEPVRWREAAHAR